MKQQKRNDYAKFLQRYSGKNTILSGYLAERSYFNNLSASLYVANYQRFIRGGK